MNIDDTDRLAGLIVSSIVILGAVLGWIRYVRPRMRRGYRRIVAVFDAILGREPITDSITGKEIAPAQPGIGVRMATTEENLRVLAEAVAKIADSHLRLDDHEVRLKNLEDARVERVVARAESAQAWRTIEKAIQAEPDETPDL